MKHLKRIFEANRLDHGKTFQIDDGDLPRTRNFGQLFTWIKENVKPADHIRYNYEEHSGFSDNLKRFDNFFLRGLRYLEHNGERIYFFEQVEDRSALSDCDVRYDYKRMSPELLNQLKADVASINI